MYYTYATIPAGNIMLTSDGDILSGIYWCVYKHAPQPQQGWIEDQAKFGSVLDQLNDYFAGKRRTFNVVFEVKGTPFQKRVWNELSTIDFGETQTYQQIASAIGAPSAVRAVAGAIGRNPLSIVVPCHRVIGSNGQLTGFAGGIESKRLLLTLEGVAI
jgi:O-6-methylguanine DNA methyltransferase